MKARRPHEVARFSQVVGVLAIGIVYAVEFPEHPQKIRLSLNRQPGRQTSDVLEPPPAQMLAIDHCLAFDQLLIKTM